MKKYIAPDIGITYFESEGIMTGNDLVELSLLDSKNLFGGANSDGTTKNTGSISFGSLKGN